MAEVFFLTRGHMDHVERFIRSMRSLVFPFSADKKLKDDFGKEWNTKVNGVIDGQLRPYQLWSYVCPENFVEPLCNSLGIPTEETWFNTEISDETGTSKGGNSFISGFGAKAHLEALRLLLRADKLPVPDKKDPKGYSVLTQPIYKNHVNVLGIGWRPDKKGETALGNHELI